MDALVLVDLQNDFCPGGALPVPEGDRVVPIANRLLGRFPLVVATQDWHPADHGSFAASHPGRQVGDVIELGGVPQVLWPVHCVTGTPGAELHPDLDRSRIEQVFLKGTDREVDSYSGLFDNGHRRATGLAEYLHAQDVEHIFLAGLATEYCVLFTALDAVQEGFRTSVILDACRGLDLHPGDVQRAIDQMRAQGVRIVSSSELLR